MADVQIIRCSIDRLHLIKLHSKFVEDGDDVVHVFDGINAGSGEIKFWNIYRMNLIKII